MSDKLSGTDRQPQPPPPEGERGQNDTPVLEWNSSPHAFASTRKCLFFVTLIVTAFFS